MAKGASYPPCARPILSVADLQTSRATHIFGSGDLAAFAYCRLPEQRRAKVIIVDDGVGAAVGSARTISFSAFCRTHQATDRVVFASYRRDLLPFLSQLTLADLADVTDINNSYRAQTLLCQETRAASVILSTVPRSGTFRLQYFLFALNELLRSGEMSADAHRLYLHTISGWNHVLSHYYLAQAFAFIGAKSFSFGHYIPPGYLAVTSNSAFRAMLARKTRSVQESCARAPEVRMLSGPFEEWLFEPDMRQATPGGAKFALVARDIVDQLVSLLTLYESVVLKVRRMGAEHWPSRRFVEICAGLFRNFVLYCLDGRAPMIIEQAVKEHTTFTRVLVATGYLEALIVDYALHIHSAMSWELGQAKVFSYEDMVARQGSFFRGLIEFFRGSELSAAEMCLVERAAMATSKSHLRDLETKLGHALSYKGGKDLFYGYGSHMTDLPDAPDVVAQTRTRVRAEVNSQEDWIRSRLAAALEDLAQGSREAGAVL